MTRKTTNLTDKQVNIILIGCVVACLVIGAGCGAAVVWWLV